jgi:two-component sensor histidine kinase
MDVEIGVFLNDKRRRVQVSGADVLLAPQAFFHAGAHGAELVTNSTKYGSLKDSKGLVNVTLERTPSSALASVGARGTGGRSRPPSGKASAPRSSDSRFPTT